MSDDGLFPGFDAVLVEAQQMQDPDRIVGRTRLVWKQRRSVIVSTVLLPWASDYADAPPFETLVIGQTHLLPRPMDTLGWDDIGGRYWTLSLAQEGHRAWCRMVAGWLTHAGRHTVTWQEMRNW